MYLAQRIMYQVDDILKEDMLNEYYYLPKTLYNTLASPEFDDLKRTDASQVDGQDDTSEDDDNESEKLTLNLQIVSQRWRLFRNGASRRTK